MSELTTESVEVVESEHLPPAGAIGAAADPEALVDDELLVEDVSIDGMCGVY